MIIDELLEKSGLKYENLTPVERETLHSWINALQKGAVNVEKIKRYIADMKYAVEQDLTKASHNSKQDLFLKARLRNYILLEAFLVSPERAKEQLEKAIAGIANSIK